MKNKQLKVATVIGTRPEIIRLSRILAYLEKTCDHSLILLVRTMIMSSIKYFLMIWVSASLITF